MERFTIWGAQGQVRLRGGRRLHTLAWDHTETTTKLCVIEAELDQGTPLPGDPSAAEQPQETSNEDQEDRAEPDVSPAVTPPPSEEASESGLAEGQDGQEASTAEEPAGEEPVREEPCTEATSGGAPAGSPLPVGLGERHLPGEAAELTLGEESCSLEEPPGLPPEIEPVRNREVSSQSLPGRSGVEAVNLQRGSAMREAPAETGAPISIAHTVRRAARRRGAAGAPGPPTVQESDLHTVRRRRSGGSHTVLLVDGSSSLGQSGLSVASRTVTRTVDSLASRRGAVSVILAAGGSARTLLERSTSPVRARRAVSQVPAGGGTPLAHGVELALKLLAGDGSSQRRIVMITDGQPTVALAGTHVPLGEAWAELSALLVQAVGFCQEVVILPVGISSDRVLTRNMALFQAAGVTVGSLLKR